MTNMLRAVFAGILLCALISCGGGGSTPPPPPPPPPPALTVTPASATVGTGATVSFTASKNRHYHGCLAIEHQFQRHCHRNYLGHCCRPDYSYQDGYHRRQFH